MKRRNFLLAGGGILFSLVILTIILGSKVLKETQETRRRAYNQEETQGFSWQPPASPFGFSMLTLLYLFGKNQEQGGLEKRLTGFLFRTKKVIWNRESFIGKRLTVTLIVLPKQG